jgi:hypothetical protein
MDPDPMTDTATPDQPRRKPRLALMGEFSAGKSTLTNLLLGGTPLPVRVTATRLPPVWIAWGDGPALREGLDGTVTAIDGNDLESVPIEQTRLIRLFMREDILEICDLIDMPGISDPNMGSEVWERVIGEADHVIWCTHATQAWRQSEAAVWETVPEQLRQRSLLLLTRFDKIVSAPDRDRVLARVRRETRGQFADMFPISLTEATGADADRALWDRSGAEPFVRRLIGLLTDPEAPGDDSYDPTPEAAVPAPPDPTPTAPDPVADPDRIRPRRIRMPSVTQTAIGMT